MSTVRIAGQIGGLPGIVHDVRTAVLSDDDVYRYQLTREWDVDGPTLAFVMLNPSTADHAVDDPTIRRCLGFARRWGYGRLTVANCFALRSTNPKALASHPDPIGPENPEWLGRTVQTADCIIAAWGGSYPQSLDTHVVAYSQWLRTAGAHVLGVTGPGDPRHPLYVRADTDPVRWDSL